VYFVNETHFNLTVHLLHLNCEGDEMGIAMCSG